VAVLRGPAPRPSCRTVHLPATKAGSTVPTVRDHGSAPACEKRDCFRFSLWLAAPMQRARAPAESTRWLGPHRS
jgi:hypothetical protein